MDDNPDITVIRSARRKKTVSASWVDGVIEVRVPAHLSEQAEAKIVSEITEKLTRSKQQTRYSDADLEQRADEINRRYLDSRAHMTSIRWVKNQRKRWGSYSSLTGEIRISDRLRGVPDYVLDSVIAHELTHTFIHSGHSAEFWHWADRIPYAERAKGFLEAWARQPVSRSYP
ncbi:MULTISPECIES: SprT-like domain-containing protein [unclassified Corynebacterium]|uniref:SprT-like domain-containing protein n=1 Tax=unclassified Corynebacterium TaxID=2624378 RepID=UPI002167FAEE|nr:MULTISPECIES: SprT-like domain-containing protein [unclassified Corynebacterium]MCS4489457.1 DUF45 domain-containing protein [Corynebacterium sp. ES2775-CONJ]MCS4491532.1 DUF45 domain-containing protein [Corynebacterium sp. ES2715-CONJ3]